MGRQNRASEPCGVDGRVVPGWLRHRDHYWWIAYWTTCVAVDPRDSDRSLPDQCRRTQACWTIHTIAGQVVGCCRIVLIHRGKTRGISSAEARDLRQCGVFKRCHEHSTAGRRPRTTVRGLLGALPGQADGDASGLAAGLASAGELSGSIGVACGVPKDGPCTGPRTGVAAGIGVAGGIVGAPAGTS